MEIDHIDGNCYNNKAGNLRAVSHKTNCENRGKFASNSSGVTGVGWHVTSQRTYCRASWRDNGKPKNKYFSVSLHGLPPAFRLSVVYRDEMINQLNLNGANYTERHKQ